MSSYLIKTASPPNPAPLNWVQTEAPDVYLYAGPALNLPGATIIGEWLEDGTPVQVNEAEYLAIRPLGNADGQATETLRYHYWLGEQPRQIGNPAATDPMERLYPTDNLPFAIEVRHKLFTGNANPAWDGWGWRAEIIGGAASRDPSARAIGIYSDAECTQYLYTTGAFTQQPSAWQLDEQGQPITVWATEYNPGLLGYPNDTKADVHHACLLGAAQEGHATLRATDDRAYHEFWEHDQGYVPPPAATWVDTTATVVQHVASGVYNLSKIVTGLVLDQPVRIGELAAGETKFRGYWPTAGTPSTYITVLVDKGNMPNAKVYKWA